MEPQLAVTVYSLKQRFEERRTSYKNKVTFQVTSQMSAKKEGQVLEHLLRIEQK